jgi:hypothetical protein
MEVIHHVKSVYSTLLYARYIIVPYPKKQKKEATLYLNNFVISYVNLSPQEVTSSTTYLQSEWKYTITSSKGLLILWEN